MRIIPNYAHKGNLSFPMQVLKDLTIDKDGDLKYKNKWKVKAGGYPVKADPVEPEGSLTGAEIVALDVLINSNKFNEPIDHNLVGKPPRNQNITNSNKI